MARGSGIREGRNTDPDRPDQSGSVGQDSKGIMHAWVGRTPGIGHGGSCGVAWVRERVGILGMAPGVARRAPSPDLLRLREAWVSCEGDEGFVKERVFSFQARVGTLAMIANTFNDGRKAAGAETLNNAMDNTMVVPKTGSTDHYNAGESVNKISESRPASPTRRSSPQPSTLNALWGVAAGGEKGATPDGRTRKAKELTEGSAEHDAVFARAPWTASCMFLVWDRFCDSPTLQGVR